MEFKCNISDKTIGRAARMIRRYQTKKRPLEISVVVNSSYQPRNKTHGTNKHKQKQTDALEQSLKNLLIELFVNRTNGAYLALDDVFADHNLLHQFMSSEHVNLALNTSKTLLFQNVLEVPYVDKHSKQNHRVVWYDGGYHKLSPLDQNCGRCISMILLFFNTKPNGFKIRQRDSHTPEQSLVHQLITLYKRFYASVALTYKTKTPAETMSSRIYKVFISGNIQADNYSIHRSKEGPNNLIYFKRIDRPLN